MSSQDHQTFLVEAGVEEIPSRYVDQLAAAFSRGLQDNLTAGRLDPRHAQVFYTPRRLVFQADVAVRQADEHELVRGPAVSVAWQDGKPSPALEGFLRRVQVPEDELSRQVSGGKEYVVASVQKSVARAADILPSFVEAALTSLPLPRSMRWSDHDARFIRPVRWLLLLLEDQVLSGEVFSVQAGDVTYGNRTDHPGALRLESVADYWLALNAGMVDADAAHRREDILERGAALAGAAGGRVDFDQELLDEVTNLVEWPTPFLGSFDERFLEIPEPILVTSMRVHQRYFPVRGADGCLLPHFLAVRNGAGEALDLVRRGNEKVLRARLSDARYFFDIDRRTPLDEHRDGLAGVTLHAKLGTYRDKVERVKALFSATETWWRLLPGQRELMERSADLYKCDLLTQVVAEFPELQGDMGGIYASLDGEDPLVVDAIRDQYHPGFPGDRVPPTRIAQLLGLLDRTDTLMAFYNAKIKATGSEDPYGLRRVALGLARLAVETDVLGDHTVPELLNAASQAIKAGPGVADEVYQLVQNRLQSLLETDWPAELVGAALAVDFPWSRLMERLAFLQEHRASSTFDDVAAAFKRVSRIGRDHGETARGAVYTGIEARLHQAASAALATPEHDLRAWWSAVEGMLPLIAQFFEDVLVMDPDPDVRSRRLGLLQDVQWALGRYYTWDQL